LQRACSTGQQSFAQFSPRVARISTKPENAHALPDAKELFSILIAFFKYMSVFMLLPSLSHNMLKLSISRQSEGCLIHPEPPGCEQLQ